jgi:ABC-type transporter Mla MlaB component
MARRMHSHQRRIKPAMLRITHARTETEQRWTLCGQLTRPWVAELRACWEHRREGAVSARTVVDLNDVTFIDESGEKLLSEMVSDGAEFIATGVETKHLLKNLKGKGERPLRRFIGPPANHCEKSGEKNGITKDEGSK